VLEKTGSATAMGTVLIFSFLPMLLFLLVGGVAVDRLPRGRVMLLSDIVRGVLVLLVAVLAFANALEIWHVCVASAVFGFVGAFFQPAYTAIIPEITPSEALPSANSLTAVSGQLTGILGPALGATVVSLGGTSAAFALDGLSFIISAACLVPIVGLLGNPRKSNASSAIHDLREGIKAVFASPWLWITITLAGLMNLSQIGPWTIGLPFLVKQNLNADVGTLGLFYSVSSLGSVLAAIWLGRSPRLRRRGMIGYGMLVVWGLAEFAVGLPLPLFVLLIAAGFFGGSLMIFNLIWANTLQETVPRDLLGRVSSIDALGSFILIPVGYGIAGWAIDWAGAAPVLVVGGALTAGLAALGLAHPVVRRLD
ncbi:MAG TPA: MFS transporter, partial [Anaerolineae bacterium]